MTPHSELLETTINQLIQHIGLDVTVPSTLVLAIGVGVMSLVAILTYWLARTILHRYIKRLIGKSSSNWEEALNTHKVFKFVSHLAPGLVIFLLNPFVFSSDSSLTVFIEKATVLYVMFSIALVLYSMLDALHFIYNRSTLAKKAPITGFIQVGKLVLVIILALLVISFLLEKSPWLLLSGVGALAAILLLVFRDTILGFVAGIQIAANRVVNTGDWIEMPKYGADGTVLAIGLTTVKVQNWDHTISTIPTYALTSEPLKNWQGMQSSTGRRIKRAIYIDIKSIKFCDPELLDKLSHLRLIKDYIEDKKTELAAYHQANQVDKQDVINQRQLTNIGTFRHYLLCYLKNHPDVNQDLTLMVRQLPPTELGIPLEVYCFSRNKNWVAYEGIQSDLFDHFLAVLPLFDLRAYQRVSDNH